jgi:hypothetical protein
MDIASIIGIIAGVANIAGYIESRIQKHQTSRSVILKIAATIPV